MARRRAARRTDVVGLDPRARESRCEEDEAMTRPRRSTGTLRKRGSVWFLRYYVDGRRVEESAETGDERVARSLLAQRRREIADGTWKAPAERAAVARVEEARAALARAIEAAPDARPLTVDAFLDGWLERRRSSGVRNARAEGQWFRDYVRPQLGAKPISEVTRVHVRELVEGLTRTTSAKTGKTLSARTVLHVYRTLSTAFSDAVLDGVIASSPCTLKTRKGELPTKRDRDPKWRALAAYTLPEIETMLGDTRIPDDRRAFYGLLALAGLRANEACGRRWADYDAAAVPLGRLVVATQADGADATRDTKTGDVREVPVVPVLAAILDDWRRVGFPMLFGRAPSPEDPIVPTRHDPKGRSFRNTSTMHESAVDDAKRAQLGRRVPWALHAMRATFLSRLENVGANMAIARRATHAAPTDIVGGYVRTTWADLCREVGKLDVQIRRPAKVLQLPVAKAASGGTNGGISGTSSAEPEKQAAGDGPRWIRSVHGFENAAHSGESTEPSVSRGSRDRRLKRDVANDETQRGPHGPDAIAELRALGFHEAADALERSCTK